MIAANMAQIHIRLGDGRLAGQLLLEAMTVVRDAGGTPTLLFCVLVEGDRRLSAGDGAGALPLLGFVRSHTASTMDNQEEIARILARVGLTADVLVPVADADADLGAFVEQVIRDLRAELAP
jgi:hypothetical protein